MKICYNCFHELDDTVRICPHCGMGADISNALQYPHALPCGSVLAGKYLTGRVLGQGGFGITYVAQNYQTKELVAVKEYYPDSMAIRDASHSVTPYNMDRSSNFEYGKERFLEEAKTLSEFIGNPHIVRVISCFEENGTAYFVMEYVRGISLKKYLQGRGGRISWQEAMLLLTPVMDALSAVHEKGIIHRDVTPDNIVIPEDGSVKLLDFGAARYSIGERSQSLDVILKHGFAPYEQYIHRSRQGSFTDVYSLAATFYCAITGLTPPEAVERIDNDKLQLPSSLGISIPAGVEAALVKALAVLSNERIQTTGELKKALEEGSADIDRTKQGIGFGRTDKTGSGENVSISTVTQGGSAQTEGGSDEKKKEDGTALPETSAVPDQAAPAKGQDPSSTQNKEIDLTQYAQNKDGQQGNGGQEQQKKFPKWLIPAAAIAAVLVIFLIVKNAGSGKGTDLQSAADGKNSNTVSAADSEANHSDKTQTDTLEEDQLSPEMRDLLAKAEQGDVSAQYELGTMYYNGTGVEQNYDEALAWYTKAAELGNTDAQYNLGEIYHNGSGTEKDDTKAIKYYRQAADSGHASAQCKYGVMLQNGEGEEKNEEEAVGWFRKAADQEDPEGEYLLGQAYFDGQGVDRDYDKAYEGFTQAAEQDLPEAQNMLGNCMKAGFGTDQDFEGAFSWYEKSAQQGLPEAQFNLAETYAAGRGVNQSDEQAAEWYASAAEQGLAKAQTNLGILYAQGKGVPQSGEEAFNWFEKAAEQGDPDGQFDLAYMYLTGTGTEQDYEKAVEFLVKAAENEEADSGIIGTAALTLAELYSETRSIDPQENKDEAARWSEIAEKQGFTNSESLLGDFIGEKLSSSDPECLEDGLKEYVEYYRCIICGRLLRLRWVSSDGESYVLSDDSVVAWFDVDTGDGPVCNDCLLAH